MRLMDYAGHLSLFISFYSIYKYGLGAQKAKKLRNDEEKEEKSCEGATRQGEEKEMKKHGEGENVTEHRKGKQKPNRAEREEIRKQRETKAKARKTKQREEIERKKEK